MKKNLIIEKNFTHYSFMNSKVTFSKRFSKNDILLKEYIIKEIIEKDLRKITLTKSKFLKILNLSQFDTIDSFLTKFTSKRINITYEKSELNSFELSLCIISSYLKNNDTYELNINNDFYKIFNTEKNDFKLFQLNILLSFNSSYSRNLFLFIKTMYNNSTIDISLENLKNIIDFENKYSRFYDLENSILIPALKEIETFTGYKIEYHKIKKNLCNNSKVIGIKFIIISTPETIKEKNLSALFNLIKPYSENTTYLNQLIEKYYESKSYEYLKNNIYYSFIDNNGNFDKFLIESIKYNYVQTKHNTKLKTYSEKYKLISNTKIKISDFNMFKNTLFKEIDNVNLSHAYLVSNFFKVLNSDNLKANDDSPYSKFINNLNKHKISFYEDNKIIILAEFNANYFESWISIFFKE
ncbi:replication initiation protein (plasmid) [Cetobacterium somerae]|uniref:replication initiation protein n=1 Tax=Cetobacterium somerae TaxID=188913 RepID=UPI002E7BDB96|nr:replication initiation protein [Cetobacterium somerae]WVJ02296.1 replication initiation protein [Cetobacterium somerae]